MFSTITDSTIWQEPDSTRLVWITMLAIADQHGYVGASMPGLAARARVSLDDCIKAIECLSEPDKWSRTTDYEGRRIVATDGGWTLLNHAKYREIQDAERRREQSRLAMQRLRSKGKEQLTDVSNVNVGLRSLTQAEAEANKSSKDDLAKKTKVIKPVDVSDDTWRDWKSHRKTKRATITDAVLQSLREQAGKAGWTIEAAMKKSIERGWAGFEADWVTKSNAQSSGKKFDPLAYINEGSKNERSRSEKTIDGEVLDRAAIQRPINNGLTFQST